MVKQKVKQKEFDDTKGADRNRYIRRKTRPWHKKRNERQQSTHSATLKTKARVSRTL